jgi:hypothetical protein
LIKHAASDADVLWAARVSSMAFYVQAAIFVFREFMRHRTFSYNEESGRYRRLEPGFYLPGPGRKLVQEGKPGAYVPGIPVGPWDLSRCLTGQAW